jgi:hypothetical protein
MQKVEGSSPFSRFFPLNQAVWRELACVRPMVCIPVSGEAARLTSHTL